MFISAIDELKDIDVPIYQIAITDNIYEFVNQDDTEYANRLINERLYGLCYANSNNEFVLVIKNNDPNSIRLNICHEYVHYVDYYKLGIHENSSDYRQLQDDAFFKLWTEFHASYLSNLHLIQLGKENIIPEDVCVELTNNVTNYLNSSSVLDVETSIDFMVRTYGVYIALHDEFNDLEKFPSEILINQDFARIYAFLYKYRTFDSLIEKREKWTQLLKQLEK